MRCAVLFFSLVAVLFTASPGWSQTPTLAELAAQVSALQSTVDTLTRYIQVVETASTSSYHGLTGPHVIFTGANVHIRNGDSTERTNRTNGLGNLIVGYNEANTWPSADTSQRGGSHNLVVGQHHQYPNSGGLVAGDDNVISGYASSVSGGSTNTATSTLSSVSGGVHNTAGGLGASVLGGRDNTASGETSSMSGGTLNTASGDGSSVSGGYSNRAIGGSSSVSGGSGNTARGWGSSVSGGVLNRATGGEASVSGGALNRALSTHSSVSGGRSNTASGYASSVSGGLSNTADVSDYVSVSGGYGNTGRGWGSTVFNNHPQVQVLQATVGTLTRYIQVVENAATSTYNGLPGPHVIFTGANVHIRNGSSTKETDTTNGVGNLIVGYNEESSGIPVVRGGSHNVVIGPEHEYTSHSGVVVGLRNDITGAYSSVSGGRDNTASGESSSVSGGVNNLANGLYTSVSGGERNTAGPDPGANVSVPPRATGESASVSGGHNNRASGRRSSISGGQNQRVTDDL